MAIAAVRHIPHQQRLNKQVSCVLSMQQSRLTKHQAIKINRKNFLNCLSILTTDKDKTNYTYT